MVPGLLQAQEGEPPLAALRRGVDPSVEPTDFGAAGTDDPAAALEAADLCPSGDVCYDLFIDYVNGEIRNPNFPEDSPQAWDKVRLRGYLGAVVDVEGETTEPMEFVAPTVELVPGDTFRLTLHNELPRIEDMELPGLDEAGNPLGCQDDAPDHNAPHCAHFNMTNMHTHGLWVSPLGNSDNVLITINPDVEFTYEYNIPSDHPAGTFWYHAHRHGSTGPQLASGMAGALIIRDDRVPQLAGGQWDPDAPGDIDVLLPRPGAAARPGPTFPERVMLFQQIAYACRNPDGSIKTFEDDDGVDEPADDSWRCDPGDVGMLEPGPENAFDQLGFGVWPRSGRHTAINGTVQKVLDSTTAGAVERWRLIHAGTRESINLQIRRAANPQAVRNLLARGSAEPEAQDEISQVCAGEPLQVVGLATDGLTRPALHPRTETWLQPGYREDILVSFPEEGTYCILNGAVAPGNNVEAQEKEPAILGLVDVAAPDEPVEDVDPAERIVDALIASASAQITGNSVRNRIIADLEDGMRLAGFVKHQPVSDDEPTGTRTVGLAIAAGEFVIGDIEQDFLGGAGLTPINMKPYDPSRIDRLLPLGATEEWFLTSFGGGGHPFHIHVNPFQVVSVMVYTPPQGCHQQVAPGEPGGFVTVEEDDRPGCNVVPSDPSTWLDVSEPGSTIAVGRLREDGTGDVILSQHAGLKDAWKDTVFTLPGHVIQVRTRYERYIGDFVLHCHILDHEDQGMMQNVRIALTDGRGGFDIPLTEAAIGRQSH